MGDQREWGPKGAGRPAGNRKPKNKNKIPQPSQTVGAQEKRRLKWGRRLRSGGWAPQDRVCNPRLSHLPAPPCRSAGRALEDSRAPRNGREEPAASPLPRAPLRPQTHPGAHTPPTPKGGWVGGCLRTHHQVSDGKGGAGGDLELLHVVGVERSPCFIQIQNWERYLRKLLRRFPLMALPRSCCRCIANMGNASFLLRFRSDRVGWGPWGCRAAAGPGAGSCCLL